MFWRPDATCSEQPEFAVSGRPEEVVEPRPGRAALFSSGWENPHGVEPLLTGTRLSLSLFFTTENLTGTAAAEAARWAAGYLDRNAAGSEKRYFYRHDLACMFVS